MPVLETFDLRVTVGGAESPPVLLDDFSLSLNSGEIVGITGISGAGKTVTALTLCGLLSPPMHWVGGRIILNGCTIVPRDPKAWRGHRGAGIFLIFQSPGAALNPGLRVGLQIKEALVEGKGLSVVEADRMIQRLLGEVGLPPGAGAFYPDQLSGGMRQRVLIAIALGLSPRVIVADEPTSGLDPIHQAEILDLMRRLPSACGSGMILISHDLGVLSRVADRIGVIHRGCLVEMEPTRTLLCAPRHPRTRRLVESLWALHEYGGNHLCWK
jgi:ABC-type glutathione transport system ATPase component